VVLVDEVDQGTVLLHELVLVVVIIVDEVVLYSLA
jgi:hypothetical protein